LKKLLLLLLVVCVPFVASAFDDAIKMKQQLKLSDDQVKAITKLTSEWNKQLDTLRKEFEQSKIDLDSMIFQKNATDSLAIYKQIDKTMDLQKKIKVGGVNLGLQIKKLLSEEQIANYVKEYQDKRTKVKNMEKEREKGRDFRLPTKPREGKDSKESKETKESKNNSDNTETKGTDKK